jgi:hypothetical protein
MEEKLLNLLQIYIYIKKKFFTLLTTYNDLVNYTDLENCEYLKLLLILSFPDITC